MANYNTTLQTNNTDLQSILDKVNALPEAGSGVGGGASVETCNVAIKVGAQRLSGPCVTYLMYNTVENGVITSRYEHVFDILSTPESILSGTYYYTGTISCVIGTILYVFDENMQSPSITTEGTTIEVVDTYGTLFAAPITSSTSSIFADFP